jgi:hypothetical protein
MKEISSIPESSTTSTSITSDATSVASSSEVKDLLNATPPSIPKAFEQGRLYKTQRQQLARKIGSQYGNRYLQRMITMVQRDSKAGSPTKPATTPASKTISRTTFEKIMKDRFGIGDIHTGTYDEQAGRVQPAVLPKPNWEEWDPGQSSEVYQQIIDVFNNAARVMGGLPQVNKIIFFKVHYENNGGTVQANSSVGASFGAGEMVIYKGATTNFKGLPMGRSSTTPPAKLPTVALGGRGVNPGSPIPLPTPEESFTRNITHELGHGYAEVALDVKNSLDRDMIKDYKKAVGWVDVQDPTTQKVETKLFDIGNSAVQAAINGGTPPPAQFEITVDNWNNPKWIEQPVTAYSLSDPSEDFPEAVMVYIKDPKLLKARSPKRFEFLDKRKSRWLSGMRQPQSSTSSSAP